jgi:hypothetical protein
MYLKRGMPGHPRHLRGNLGLKETAAAAAVAVAIATPAALGAAAAARARGKETRCDQA